MNQRQELSKLINEYQTNKVYDKFTLHEISTLAEVDLNLKMGKRLTNYQTFIHVARSYFFDYPVSPSVSDRIKVSAKRYTKYWI